MRLVALLDLGEPSLVPRLDRGRVVAARHGGDFDLLTH